MRRPLLSLSLAASAGVLVAGCAGGAAGVATPGSGGQSSETLPPGTPLVAHPLDTTKFQQAPCTVLTPAQLRQLNVAAVGKPEHDATGPGCGWNDAFGPSKSGIGIGFLTAGHGLGDLYSMPENFVVFRRLPDIEGYPAVIAASVDPQKGACSVVVGVTNDLAVSTIVTLATGVDAPPDVTTPCTRTETVARYVVQTLKGG